MGSIDSLYDKIKRHVVAYFTGNGYTDASTGYSAGELQAVVFIMVLAAMFRIFMIPLGIVVILVAASMVLHFAPVIRVIERENSSDLNRVLFWVFVYFSVIVAVTLWGR